MSVYGYARISTPKQSIDRQIRNIYQYDASAIIFKETYTGKTTERPEFNKLVNHLVKGDTLICDSVSRFSRNSDEGFELYQRMYKEGVSLVFLKEPHINTETYKKALNTQIDMTGNQIADEYIKATNNVLMILARQQIRIAFDQSQKEVDDLSQRTKEGIKTAKLKGHIPGRRKGFTYNTKKYIRSKDLIMQYAKEYGGQMKNKDLIKLCDVDPGTYFRYKRRIKEELKADGHIQYRSIEETELNRG